MWRALALFALVVVIAALLIVAFTDDTSKDRPAPSIYAQCVGNDHLSDICLGA